MLNFKEIEKEKLCEYKKYYDYSNAITYDVNILNAYLWRNEYNIRFAIYDDTLIKAYFNDDGTVWGYTMPVGKNVLGAVDEIIADAKERSCEPMISILTNGSRALLETLFPSKFEYVRSPENQDYLYLTKDLITLVGKKFHAKRNHISKFYKLYPNAHFETMDESNKLDAFTVAIKWCQENNIDTENNEELNAITESLENFEEFGMRGALIYVDDEPVAMTIGSEISKKCFDINFEKALREYDGIYSVICNEFAKTLTEYEFINREEDMGIEGLRKSKLSYNPIQIIDRYNATLK